MEEVTITLYKDECKYITQVLKDKLHQMPAETQTDKKLKEEHNILSGLIGKLQRSGE